MFTYRYWHIAVLFILLALPCLINANQTVNVSIYTDGCTEHTLQCDEMTRLDITAQPNVGYVFKSWSDGNTENPRSVIVSKDTVLVASFVFSTQFDTITIGKNVYGGTMTGAGVYMKGQTVTLTAVPDEGFTFVQWLDGSTDNPRQIKTDGNAEYTPVFSGGTGYSVKIYADGCTTSFDRLVANGVSIDVEAVSINQEIFLQWSDGVKTAKRTISVSSDTTVYAQFKKEKSVIVFINSNGSILQSSEVEHGTIPVYTGATPMHPTSPSSYEFVGWNPDVVEVTGPAFYTATYSPITDASESYLLDATVYLSPAIVTRGGQVTLFNLPSNEDVDIVVYNGVGALCQRLYSNGEPSVAIIAPYNQGTYIVSVKTQSGVTASKLIVK